MPSKDELTSTDADQPHHHQKPAVDVYEMPSRRQGFAIARGRRVFDHDTQPQSARSESPWASWKPSAAALHDVAGVDSDKRNNGRFAIVRGR